jgi:hypothetical protein
MIMTDETWPAVWRPRENWDHLTYDEGGVLPAGTLVANGTGKPEPVFTAEQVERGVAWIRDHYRDGAFRCPSDDTTSD